MTTNKTALTTQEVAARFNELAKQEKWFEIQDELFADNVRSIDPPNSPYFGYAEGKAAVRKKRRGFCEEGSGGSWSLYNPPRYRRQSFCGRTGFDITVKGFGRIKIDEIMLYEVKDGQIVLEQFFY